jgi:hypothetical protein
VRPCVRASVRPCVRASGHACVRACVRAWAAAVREEAPSRDRGDRAGLRARCPGAAQDVRPRMHRRARGRTRADAFLRAPLAGTRCPMAASPWHRTELNFRARPGGVAAGRTITRGTRSCLCGTCLGDGGPAARAWPGTVQGPSLRSVVALGSQVRVPSAGTVPGAFCSTASTRSTFKFNFNSPRRRLVRSVPVLCESIEKKNAGSVFGSPGTRSMQLEENAGATRNHGPRPQAASESGVIATANQARGY